MVWTYSEPSGVVSANKKPLWQERGVGQRVGSGVRVVPRIDRTVIVRSTERDTRPLWESKPDGIRKRLASE